MHQLLRKLLWPSVGGALLVGGVAAVWRYRATMERERVRENVERAVQEAESQRKKSARCDRTVEGGEARVVEFRQAGGLKQVCRCDIEGCCLCY